MEMFFISKIRATLTYIGPGQLCTVDIGLDGPGQTVQHWSFVEEQLWLGKTFIKYPSPIMFVALAQVKLEVWLHEGGEVANAIRKLLSLYYSSGGEDVDYEYGSGR